MKWTDFVQEGFTWQDFAMREGVPIEEIAAEEQRLINNYRHSANTAFDEGDIEQGQSYLQLARELGDDI